MNRAPVCYEYDGTFSGFLTCVFESYAYREEPVCFLSPGDGRTTLWDTRRVDADQALARRVWRGIRQNISPGAGRLASRAFLTCLEEREIHIWRFLEYGFRRGSSVTADLGDDRVDVLRRAVQHLEEEAHKYTGFVRFSDQGGVLVSEIQPKNRVLPLLRVHFTQRLNTEAFVIFDRTHREGLVHQGGRWAILPMEDFDSGPAEDRELYYRRLWRRFYDTIAIEGRENPRCRMTQMPKRFWGTMTEFQNEPEERKELAP